MLSMHCITFLKTNFCDAFRSSGNGNCLFNAASISICDDESLADILRMLCCLNLYTNAETYCSHELFNKILPAGAFRTLNSIFSACLSLYIHYTGPIHNGDSS